MSNSQLSIRIIQIIVVAFVCFIVSVLIISFFNQRRKMIEHGSLDDQIIKEAEEKKTKKYKVTHAVGNIFSTVLGVLFLGLLVAGAVAKFQNNMFPIGNNQVLLVESTSMANRNSINVYLDEYHLDNQIDLYDVIVVNKMPQEDEIQLFDIIVYKQGNRYLVHRVIDIEERNTAHPDERYFRLRGDSNSVSDTYPVTYKDMVAIYSGTKIPIIGFFVAFLQSALGILAIGIALLYSIITPIQEKKLDNAARDRLLEIYKSREPKENTNITNVLVLNASGDTDNPNYFNRVIRLLDNTVVTVQDKNLNDISENRYIELNENFEVFNENERQHYQRLLNGGIVSVPVVVSETPKLTLNIKKRSFVDKLRVSKKEVKQIYNEIKTEALSYGLKSRISFSGDTFRLHNKTYLKITMSGKTLKVFYALNPKDYIDSPIPVIDCSNQSSKKDIPSALRITSDLAIKRAKKLIEDVCTKDGLTKMEIDFKDWVNEFTDEYVSEANKETPIAHENHVELATNADGLSLDIKTKSFLEKMMQADDEVLSNYNQIKQELMSYGLKPRLSYSGETFRLHKKAYAKITISGKSLKVYYALDYKDYLDSPIPLIDCSDKPSKKETPSALRIKSDLAVKRAKILTDDACSKDGLTKIEIPQTDWAKELLNPQNNVEEAMNNMENQNNENGRVIPAITKRSFQEKIEMASKEVLLYYHEIKQELLSYGLKPRLSYSGVTFRLHKKTYAKITISGKSLKVYLALNYKDYVNSPIPLIDYSNKSSKKETPCALWIKSDLAVKRVKNLIGEICEKNNIHK